MRMKQKVDRDFLTAMIDYIKCYEDVGNTCEPAILQHFIALMKAYRKHLEENHGEYGKMLGKIQM